jgi:hypothetical protein
MTLIIYIIIHKKLKRRLRWGFTFPGSVDRAKPGLPGR